MYAHLTLINNKGIKMGLINMLYNDIYDEYQIELVILKQIKKRLIKQPVTAALGFFTLRFFKSLVCGRAW